jgi:peptidoglycan hydrolase-like protein with peptidoglycan-binding domain
MFKAGKIVTIVVGCAALTAANLTPEPARAQHFGRALGIGLGAAIIGAMAGQALAQRGRPQMQAPARRRSPAANPAAANETVQRALAALGFYAGRVTGKIDKPTQQAIASFQQKLGDKPTGKLTAVQRQVLFANYAQQVRPPAPAPTAPAEPGKPAGIMALVAAGGGAAAGAAVIPAVPPGGEGPGAGKAAVPVESASIVPFFGPVCPDNPVQNTATLPTVRTASALRLTPGQFCSARAAALVDASNALTRTGATDIVSARAECATFAQGMKAQVVAASAMPANAMGQRLKKQFAATTADQALDNMKVCLGIGYADEQPDLVLAAALGIVGLGEGGYGELIAGVFGIGAPRYDARQRAGEWLDYAAEQIEKGATAVVADLGAERAGILRLAGKEMRADPTRQQVATLEKKPALTVYVAEPKAHPALTSETASASAVIAPAAPVDPRQAVVAQAASFFAKEGQEQKAKLIALASVLDLDEAEIGRRCGALRDTAQASVGLDPSMALRLCRAWSYARADGAAMYDFDQRLAAAGDTDAQSRLPLHMLSGHDKATHPAVATAP